MNIVSLTTENFKRLKAVHIEPTGNMVIIGGRNAQGKSSVLDSIAAALGGKDAVPEMAVHQGAESGQIILDLGDIVVRRSFNAEGNTSLTVKSKDGASFASPQAMLDKMVGKLSCDPIAFVRQDPKAQLATLKTLLGLDFTKQDAERLKLYNERTAIGAVGKNAQARLSAIPENAEIPTAEVSVADLMTKMQQATAANAAVSAWIAKDKEIDAGAATISERISTIMAELQAMRDRLDATRKAKEQHLAVRPDMSNVIDPAPIQAAIVAAEQTNRIAASQRQRKQQVEQLQAEIGKATNDWNAKTAAINAIDKAKSDAIAAADMPIPGLGISDSGVLYNGIPFTQASSAEQLRVSTAMALALNPKLKVVLIRDGSLMDADNLKLVAEVAAQYQAQVWVERVTDSKEGCQVLIEDGGVAK